MPTSEGQAREIIDELVIAAAGAEQTRGVAVAERRLSPIHGLQAPDSPAPTPE